MKVFDATPAKLRDDSWGVRISGPQVGDLNQNDVVQVMISTQGGKQWERIAEVFWVDYNAQVALGRERKPGVQEQTAPAYNNTNQQYAPAQNTNGPGANVYVHAGQLQPGRPCPACSQVVPAQQPAPPPQPQQQAYQPAPQQQPQQATRPYNPGEEPF